MLDLNELTVFIRVVDEGSFTNAGRALAMPKSRVSRMVADLEEKLGCRLLQRTTRQISLTEVGAAYYNRCRHLVNEILDAHEMIADREEQPHGTLKIAIPKSGGSAVVGHYIARYLSVYPDVTIEVLHYDTAVNLIQEGFDLGIFLGPMPDSSLVARTLLESDSVLCASPDYIRRTGKPTHPRDLARMKCVKTGEGRSAEEFELVHRQSGEVCSVLVEPAVSTDLVSTAIGCIQSGVGIGDVPSLLAGEAIMSGQLTPLFSDWVVRPETVSIAYPSRQYLPSKVRTFIDFIVKEAEKLETHIKTKPTPEKKVEAFVSLIKNSTD